MMTPKFRKYIVLILIFVCILFNFSFAQHFIRLTDEQRIELALDMVRKGIQQQDTTKVFMVFAPQVSVKGRSTLVKGNLTKNVQAIFDNSFKRKIQLEKPSFSREDNPLHLSNFWDFDILDPHIKIEGDSAVVECELVLWGASPAKGSERTGRRTKERLVFKSPPEVGKAPPSGEYRKWPTTPLGKKRMSSIRSWQLVGFENLFDFLNGEIEQTERRGDEDTNMKKK